MPLIRTLLGKEFSDLLAYSTNGVFDFKITSETSGLMNSFGGVSPERNIFLNFVPLKLNLSDSV